MSNFMSQFQQHMLQYERNLRIAIAAYDETSTREQIERHVTNELAREMNLYAQRQIRPVRTPPPTLPTTPDAPLLGRRPRQEESPVPFGARRRRVDQLLDDSDDEEEELPNPEIIDLTLDSDEEEDATLHNLQNPEIIDLTLDSEEESGTTDSDFDSDEEEEELNIMIRSSP